MLDFDRYDVEEIVLCMADIVIENRKLHSQLRTEITYKKKYEDLVDQNFRNAQESNRELLKAIAAGCFRTKSEIENEI